MSPRATPPSPDEHRDAAVEALHRRIRELERLLAERTAALDAAHREARIEAALERVHAEIASMRTADDLQHITPLVWRELTTLGVPFFRCGVFIMDDDTERVHTYLTTPEGRSLAVLHLPYESADITRHAVAHWRKQTVYTEHWDRDRFVAWVQQMIDLGHLDTPESYQGGEPPPEMLVLQFVPFTQGMLYVGSAAPLDDEQIGLVRALADTFAVAYARYLDFTQLEAALAGLKETQAQLIHSEKMASLGQMTTGIAHEIKNPLNFVNNFADLNAELAQELKDELADDPEIRLAEVEDVLDDIVTNAAQIAKHGRRADAIVRSMMQHARGGTGAIEPTAINAVVEEYLDLAYHGMRASRPGFQVEVERSYDERAGQVPMKGQEIGRVLLNLLSNAFYAVDDLAARSDGAYTPKVRVTTRRRAGRVEIRISDNGPGIPPAVRERIFEPFFTTKPSGAGTGLGLSLSYDIITQGHGGTLAVESEEGKGATFTVALPLRSAKSASGA